MPRTYSATGRNVAGSFEDRVKAVEHLLKIFRLERLVYLFTTGLALVLLIVSSAELLFENENELAVASALFGSSGLITYSIGRLLRMWDQALRLLQGATTLEDSDG